MVRGFNYAKGRVFAAVCLFNQKTSLALFSDGIGLISLVIEHKKGANGEKKIIGNFVIFIGLASAGFYDKLKLQNIRINPLLLSKVYLAVFKTRRR